MGRRRGNCDNCFMIVAGLLAILGMAGLGADSVSYFLFEGDYYLYDCTDTFEAYYGTTEYEYESKTECNGSEVSSTDDNVVYEDEDDLDDYVENGSFVNSAMSLDLILGLGGVVLVFLPIKSSPVRGFIGIAIGVMCVIMNFTALSNWADTFNDDVDDFVDNNKNSYSSYSYQRDVLQGTGVCLIVAGVLGVVAACTSCGMMRYKEPGAQGAQPTMQMGQPQQMVVGGGMQQGGMQMQGGMQPMQGQPIQGQPVYGQPMQYQPVGQQQQQGGMYPTFNNQQQQPGMMTASIKQ